MKTLWKFLMVGAALLLGTSLWGQGAQEYVRSGAAGNGSDWANACADLTGSCAPVRGTTYYVASGSYASRTFSTADSGTAPITIKGATVADHGTDVGWSAAYSVSAAEGGSQATWGALAFTSDYWVWDGAVGPVWDRTPADYGFSFGTGLSRAVTIGTAGSSGGCGSATHDVTIANFYGKATGGDVEKEFEEGNAYGGALANVTFSHFLIDGWQGLFMTKSGACSSAPYTGWVVQYGVLLNGSSTSANHGEWINPNERALSGVIIRYNVFDGNSGNAGETGVIVANNSANTGAQIYGNVFNNNLVGNGIITGTSAGSLSNAVIYNNTFSNMPSASGDALCGSGQGSGNVAYNNLFYHMSAAVGGGCATDYDAYFGTTNTPGEAHGQTSSANPFTATGNYHLATETASGVALAAPYNVDAEGNARPGADGVWSRGALQYGGVPPPPAALNVTTTALPSASAGSAYVASVSASGGTPPYGWTITGQPGWLSATVGGALSGTPAAADVGTVLLSTTVTDAVGATASKNLSFQVNAPPPVSVSVVPATVTMLSGATQQFTATVSNAANAAVSWAATGGTISGSGLFTAPAAAGSVTVTATSVADATKSATASVTVTVSPPPSTTSTFGNTTTGTTTDTGDSNAPMLGRFQSGPAGGAAVSISVYEGATLSAAPNNQFQLALYADNNGNPGVLLAKTASGTLKASAWNTLPIAANVAASTYYWLAYNANGTSASADNLNLSNGGKSCWKLGTAFGTWPSPMTTNGCSAVSLAEYLTYSTVAPPVAVTVSPSAATVGVGQTQQFAALVVNTTKTSVTWTSSCGSVDGSGLYTAPGTAGTCTVTATSVADATKSATASVTVSPPPPSLSINCQNALPAFTAANLPSGTILTVTGTAGGVTATCSVALP